jgi:hypothetical protein
MLIESYPLPEGASAARPRPPFVPGSRRASWRGATVFRRCTSRSRAIRVDPAKATTTKDQLAELAAFQTKVRAVRIAPRERRMQLAQVLVANEGTIVPTTYAL